MALPRPRPSLGPCDCPEISLRLDQSPMVASHKAAEDNVRQWPLPSLITFTEWSVFSGTIGKSTPPTRSANRNRLI
jgi:hypothetical protein